MTGVQTCALPICAKNTWYKYRIKAYRVVNGKKVVFAEAMELHILTKGSKKITNPSGISVSQKNINLKAGEKGKISVDAYDPNDLRVKLKGQYEVAQDTYLIGQIKDINDSDERAAYVGLRHEF